MRVDSMFTGSGINTLRVDISCSCFDDSRLASAALSLRSRSRADCASACALCIACCSKESFAASARSRSFSTFFSFVAQSCSVCMHRQGFTSPDSTLPASQPLLTMKLLDTVSNYLLVKKRKLQLNARKIKNTSTAIPVILAYSNRSRRL